MEHKEAQKSLSLFQESWRAFKKNRMAWYSFVFLVALSVFAVIGKIAALKLPFFDPSAIRLADKLSPPLTVYEGGVGGQSPLFGVYWLGTDDLGRDILSRMLEGTSVSLTIGAVAVGISLIVGIGMGGLAGYYGEKKILFFTVDDLIMRFVDIMLCFPAFFLILTVVALLPANIYNIMIVIGLTGWMGTARFVRAEFLSLRERDFVLSARSQAIPEWRIIFIHMVPNAMAPVLVSAVIGVATAILTESSLSFLGFGVQPPSATWGNILSDGKQFIFDAPWITFVPGLSILVVVLAFNLCGEGLREAFNPKLRRKR